MIELLSGFPENVVAVSAKGNLQRQDYVAVLEPAVEAAFAKHSKVRFYYELGPELHGVQAGAAWEDLKVGVRHWTAWERIAVVTDIEWIRHSINAFAFLMPGRVRTFPQAEAEAAHTWISAA